MMVHESNAWLLWLAAAVAPALAADDPPPVEQRDYARPQQLIDIGGGRRMNLFCKGSGSPTVVFDSGTGLAGWDWLLVHPAIARKTRACVYDRPGFGFAHRIGEPPPMFGAPPAAVFLTNKMSPAFWDAAHPEEENEATSSDQLRRARKSFGDLPLVYLTRSISPFLVPGQPQGEMNKATERDVMAMHDEIARLSTRGRNRLVPGAGHSIHIDKPQAVIDAIDEVLGQVRSAPRAR